MDMRYYAKVSFLDFEEYGLLDTGANISCIGGKLAKMTFINIPISNQQNLTSKLLIVLHREF